MTDFIRHVVPTKISVLPLHMDNIFLIFSNTFYQNYFFFLGFSPTFDSKYLKGIDI